jgi:hypothetical protein
MLADGAETGHEPSIHPMRGDLQGRENANQLELGSA